MCHYIAPALALQSLQTTVSEGIFKSILSSSTSSAAHSQELHRRREERLRSFQDRAELATSRGGAGIPPMLSHLRANYYRDFLFLQENLARLGTELKNFPGINITRYMISTHANHGNNGDKDKTIVLVYGLKNYTSFILI